MVVFIMGEGIIDVHFLCRKPTNKQKKKKRWWVHHCLLYVCIFEHVSLTENWAFIGLMNNLIDLLFHDHFLLSIIKMDFKCGCHFLFLTRQRVLGEYPFLLYLIQLFI